MKLNSTQVKQTLSQFQAEVLPDNHPAVAQLNNLFGDHTFFLDGGGLKVLEPTGTSSPSATPNPFDLENPGGWGRGSRGGPPSCA